MEHRTPLCKTDNKLHPALTFQDFLICCNLQFLGIKLTSGSNQSFKLWRPRRWISSFGCVVLFGIVYYQYRTSWLYLTYPWFFWFLPTSGIITAGGDSVTAGVELYTVYVRGVTLGGEQLCSRQQNLIQILLAFEWRYIFVYTNLTNLVLPSTL